MARLDWGFTDEEFADLDVRELPVFLKRHAESEKRRAWQEYREAFLCFAFTIANRLVKENGQPFALGDFLPSDDEPARPTRPQTPEQMLLLIMAHNAAHGGTVH